MSSNQENGGMDFGGDEFADVDLGVGASLPETSPPISDLDFMDLYVRIDPGAGFETETRYQTEQSSAMLIVPVLAYGVLMPMMTTIVAQLIFIKFSRSAIWIVKSLEQLKM